MSKLVRSEGFPAAEAMEDATMVRAMYRALEEGDAPALTRYTDPLIKWVHPMVARLPFDGTRRGLQAVLWSAFQRNTDGLGPRVSAETFLEFGDGVLVAGRLLGSQRAKDESNERPFLHECFVHGGRVTLIREYPAKSKGDR